MNEYPHALSYYLVKHFQPQCTSLSFDRGSIKVCDDDVHEVLRLPIRDRKLVFLRSKHIEDMWRGQYIFGDRPGW